MNRARAVVTRGGVHGCAGWGGLQGAEGAGGVPGEAAPVVDGGGPLGHLGRAGVGGGRPPSRAFVLAVDRGQACASAAGAADSTSFSAVVW